MKLVYSSPAACFVSLFVYFVLFPVCFAAFMLVSVFHRAAFHQTPFALAAYWALAILLFFRRWFVFIFINSFSHWIHFFVLATQSQLRLHFTRAVIQISWQRVFLNDRDKGSFEHQNEIKMKTRQNKSTSKTNCESARRFANVNNKISN